MDADACNYNENAACDDGSCEQVLAYVLQGEQLPGVFSQYEYSYTETIGSSYEWFVTGGVALVPNTGPAVSVMWGEQGVGEVCVQETNSDDCLGPQVCLGVVVMPPTSVVEVSSDFRLFPNPSKTEVHLQVSPKWVGCNYTIANAIGKVVATSQILSSLTTLNVESLSSGVYSIKLSGYLGEMRTLRLVVEQ
jgi:hypothetical protein